MKKMIPFLWLGLIILAVLLPGTASAWTAFEKQIQVRFAQIKLSVDGQEINTSAEPFI